MRFRWGWTGTASGDSAKLRTAVLRQRLESLTPRERAVLPRVVSGLLNKQIAAEIGTTEATVKVHRSQLMRKMGAYSLPDLVRMAEKIGIPGPKVTDLGR